MTDSNEQDLLDFTPEQIQNWRQVLKQMPLFSLAVRFMTDEQVAILADRMRNNITESLERDFPFEEGERVEVRGRGRGTVVGATEGYVTIKWNWGGRDQFPVSLVESLE